MSRREPALDVDFAALDAVEAAYAVWEPPPHLEELIAAARETPDEDARPFNELAEAMRGSRCVFVNRAGVETLKAPDREFLRAFVSQWWFDSSSRSAFARRDAARALLGRPSTTEYDVVSLDSQNREYTNLTEEFRTEDGRVFLLVSAVDYTQRRRMIRAHEAYRRQLEFTLESQAETLRGTRETAIAATELIVRIVSRRDPYTGEHMQMVAELADAIAGACDMSEQDRELLRTACLIHDVGKLSVPAELLNKSAPLTPAETVLVRDHVRLSVELLDRVGFPKDVVRIVAQHHERLDGSGYPEGVAGDDICRGARVLAIADVVTAMGQHRPYRAAATPREILDEIALGRGALYDREIAGAALNVLRDRLGA